MFCERLGYVRVDVLRKSKVRPMNLDPFYIRLCAACCTETKQLLFGPSLAPHFPVLWRVNSQIKFIKITQILNRLHLDFIQPQRLRVNKVPFLAGPFSVQVGLLLLQDGTFTVSSKNISFFLKFILNNTRGGG